MMPPSTIVGRGGFDCQGGRGDLYTIGLHISHLVARRILWNSLHRGSQAPQFPDRQLSKKVKELFDFR
jgi:hypothetical protein